MTCALAPPTEASRPRNTRRTASASIAAALLSAATMTEPAWAWPASSASARSANRFFFMMGSRSEREDEAGGDHVGVPVFGDPAVVAGPVGFQRNIGGEVPTHAEAHEGLVQLLA